MALSTCATPRPVETLPPPSHAGTSWEVRSAGGLEAVSFLNVLVHHPLVYPHFLGRAAAYEKQMPQEVKDAVASLKDFSEQELRGAPASPLFKPLVACAMVYGDPLDTTADVTTLLANPDQMESALKRVQELTGPRNSYYSPEGFAQIMKMVPDVSIILSYLEAQGFDGEWQAEIRPALDDKASQLLSAVRQYNVVPEVEKLLGYTLPSDHVVFYVLQYIKPFGNHIIPGYFASEPWIPDGIIVRTAIHELLHDPCYNYDPEFWKAMSDVLRDPFVAKAYESRDTKFGYNNPGYYVVENSVRVLDQIASEELDVARPLSDRFGYNEDNGMHVIAPALYVVMKDQGFPVAVAAGDSSSSGSVVRTENGANVEGFREFIIRMYKACVIGKGRMKALYDRYFAEFAGTEPRQ